MKRFLLIPMSFALLVSVTAQSAPDLARMYRQLEEQRAIQLDRLHSYTMGGRFPRNTGHPGVRTPYFVDRFGTRCAVGELMWWSGKREAVHAIAKANNQVRVMEVSDGALIDWVVGSGLTQWECAQVQPTYEFYYYAAEKERVRIQSHLLAVEAKLRKQTAKSLGEALRVALDHKIDIAKLTKNHKGALLDALAHKEPNVRIGAAHALGRLRIDDRDARDALMARLKDEEREVRFWAAAALLETLAIPRDPGPHGKLLKVFAARLKHGDEAERLLAVGRIGVLARGAAMVPGEHALLREIRKALTLPASEKSKDVRVLATWMLAVADQTYRGMGTLANYNVGRIFLEMQDGNEAHAAALRLKPKRLKQLLASTPALLNARNRFGQTPLHLAAQSSWTQYGELFNRKPDVNARDAAGCIPLHKSTWIGVGGDIKAKDSIYGWTPLHYAAHRGNGRAIQSLLEEGADANAKDKHGFTPLHLAVGCETEGSDPIRFGPRANNWLGVRWLVQGGADASIKDARGRTPLWWAKHRKLAQAITELGGKPEPKRRPGAKPKK